MAPAMDRACGYILYIRITCGYEVAVIIQDGIRRMYQEKEDIFYYLTTYNENYPQLPMPEGVEEGIRRGIYRLRAAEDGEPQLHLFGSGSIVNEALRAQVLLKEQFGVRADVWSVTSYVELRREALVCQRWNRLHPGEKARTHYVVQALGKNRGLPIVAASDYMKVLPDGLTAWLPGQITALGTDGFGRSENREYLRRYFEIDAENIAFAAISRLAADKLIPLETAIDAPGKLGINPDKPDAACS